MSDQTTAKRITIEKAGQPVTVNFHGAVIASTNEALVLKETGYEPVYYLPTKSVAMGFLRESDKKTTCPHKGEARYWSISAEGQGAPDAVWAYDEPIESVQSIAGHVAFDRKAVDITAG